jgi:two-component system, cell cycle response regulator DivK
MATRQKILIVEDFPDARELLALFIRRLGYEVVEAATGLAALDQACATQPDLILMDLGLPGMTGDEVTVRLKANPSTRSIPIVINTAFQDGALTARALAAGAAEILYKPTPFNVVIETLRRHLATEPANSPSVDQMRPELVEGPPNQI